MTITMDSAVVPVLLGKGAYQENALQAAPAALPALLTALSLTVVQVAVWMAGFAQLSCNCLTCAMETVTVFAVPVSVAFEADL